MLLLAIFLLALNPYGVYGVTNAMGRRYAKFTMKKDVWPGLVYKIKTFKNDATV